MLHKKKRIKKSIWLTLITLFIILFSLFFINVSIGEYPKNEPTENIGIIDADPEDIQGETEAIKASLAPLNINLNKYLEKEQNRKTFYSLSPFQREYIEKTVMGEMGTESYLGQVAVAQCILDMSEYKGVDPVTAINTSKCLAPKKEPNEKVKRAVSEVFDKGQRVTINRLLYFYPPSLSDSRWHESQKYITTIDGVRFFDTR